MNENTVNIPTSALHTSVRALLNASRFDEAAALLDATTGSDGDTKLALAKAEATVASNWFHSRATGAGDLSEPERIVEAHGDAETKWDFAIASVRGAYAKQLFEWTGRRTAEGRDQEAIGELRRRTEQLRDNAPDGRRRGWAEFQLGVTADNVFGERDVSPAHYEAALKAGEEHGDDHLIFEALRHLGDHDHDAGDHELTRQRWERSAHHAAKAGLVGSTLAQLQLVAVSARDRGDEAAAVALGSEIVRWADAIGFERARDMAESFVKGVDPTKEPEEG